MKAYEGFKAEPSGGAYPMLPVGGYVCKIENVKIDGQEPDQQLVLRLEICEGEYTGYYTKRYQHDCGRNASRHDYGSAKYKGDFRLQIPNMNNKKREHPEWDVSTFNGFVYCVMKSNDGYKWEWDEKSLKGLLIGINVRAGTYNGNPYTQIGRLETVEDVRKGAIKPMRPKEDTNPPAVDDPRVLAAGGFTQVELSTEELPF